MCKKFNDGYLKQAGVDAEKVKEEFGCYPVSHYDVYNGDTVTIRDKSGNLFNDTGLSKTEFFNEYGKHEEKEYTA